MIRSHPQASSANRALHGIRSGASALAGAFVLALAACGGGSSGSGAPVTPAPPAPAPTISFQAAPQAVPQANAANLTWSSSNTSGCVASGGWSGTRSTAGAESTGPLAATTAYTLSCTGAGGSAEKTVQVDVAVVPPQTPAPTVTLAVAPTSVVSGGSATLTWSSTDATACVASGNWSGNRPTAGTASTGALSADSAFALTCTGPGGSATQSVNVAVTLPVVPTVSLAAAPSTVLTGGTSTLSWSATNATACTATGAWSGSRAVSGSQVLQSLQTTATYGLTCTGAGGSASQSVTVTVLPPAANPPPVVTLGAAPSTVAYGGSSTLTWSATNATSCTASGGWSGAKATSGSQSTGALTATQTYTLTCTGPGGTAAQVTQVQVTPPPVPSISFTATPTSVLSGGTTTLSWSASNATSCTASGGWAGTKATSGTQVSGALTVATDFVLTCTGAGGTASRTVTVNVTQPVPTLTLTAAPAALVQGGSSTLTWNSANATSCTASGAWSGTKPTSGSESTGTLSSVGTFSYTLSCSGPGGVTSRTANVVVSAAPPAPTVVLAANPALVASGGTSTLTWSSTNATSCTASGGWSGSKATSGSQLVGPLATTSTFSLSCTGPGGTATAAATVTVSSPAPTLSLTASPSSVVQGATSTLSWNASNATSCTASEDWSGNRAVSGSESTPVLSQVRTYRYTLTCTGPGGSVTQSATVSVSASSQAPTVTITPSPSQVGVNGVATLTWTVANATSCTASGGWSGSKNATNGAEVMAALLQTTNFVLSCTGSGGTTAATAKVLVTGSMPATVFPLRTGGDSRHLVDQNNLPFLAVGDTPWSLITAVTKADAALYLDDRRARGFNAIIVNIIERHFNGPVTREGAEPFAKTGNVYNFAQPNEAYFAHVDHVLALARDRGFLVLLTPAYLGYGGGEEGWWPDINTAVNTEAVMEGYGRYLGTRYRGFNNIIWVMGGDWYGSQSLGRTRALVRGLQATDQAGRLFTAHNARFESGALYYNDEPWFTVNTTYADCVRTPELSRADYQRTPVRPFVFFEGRYENEGSSTLRCLRSQAYWPVLMGSFGSFFGNRPMWLFDAGWKDHLASAGSQSMAYYGRLFRSRNWSKLVPDASGSVLTNAQSLGADYASAARASDSSSVIVYTPFQQALNIDLTKVGGSQLQGWWFNPANGAAVNIGTMAATGTRAFTPPAAGDWVLVLDDASLGLPAPGQ